MLNALGRADGFAAVLAVEHGDRQTPAALTGDAPVGTVADHGDHAILAPCGQPLHVVAGGNRLVLERFDRAEPLRGCAEDDRALAAPAMRIAVNDLLRGEQRAGSLHIRQNDGVGFFRFHAGVLSGIVGMTAAVIDRNDQLHAVAAAGLVVIGAEARSGMDAAGTGIHCDIFGVEQTGGLVQEGMLCQHIFKEAARMRFDDFIGFDAGDAHDLFRQRFGNDVHFAVFRLDDGVALTRMQADGHIAGQRPDRCRPDDEAELAVIQMRKLAQIILHGEFDVDRSAGIVLIFDLGLGKRGFVLRAPVDGLQTLIDVALAEHLAKDLDLLRLKMPVHGAVGMRPVAHDTQTLEACHLPLNKIFGKFFTGIAELGDGHGLVIELVFLDDRGFNRHAVVIPAGRIGRIVAAHGIGTDDEILQRLVQRMAHVDIAVGEGRAVMQNEGGLALVLFEQQGINIDFVPVFQHTRLTGRQTGTHREVGLRGDDGIFIIHKLPP